MKPDSDWDALRARLTQTQEAVAAEIRAYPACGARARGNSGVKI